MGCQRLDKLPPQPDRGKSETEISSGQINCFAWGPAKCRVNPGENNGSLVIWLNVSGISVDGQRLLPAPSWLGLRPVVLVARAQHALGSNLSDLEMHATSAESTGSCVCCTHCPSLAGSKCSPREQQQQQHRQHRRSRVHSNEANIIKPQAHVVFGESCKRISHSLAPSLVSPSLSLSLVV